MKRGKKKCSFTYLPLETLWVKAIPTHLARFLWRYPHEELWEFGRLRTTSRELIWRI